MSKYLLQSLEGVNLFGITSLVTFFIFFSAVTAYAFMSKKTELDKMAALPLEDNEQ